MHWGKQLSREVFPKLNFVAFLFPSKFDQRDYRRSVICYLIIGINTQNIYRFFQLEGFRYAGWIYCESFKSCYRFFSEKQRVECKILLINYEISRNFFFHFCILFPKIMIGFKKFRSKKCWPGWALYRDIFNFSI